MAKMKMDAKGVRNMLSILVVFNKHNTARIASCWFIIYYSGVTRYLATFLIAAHYSLTYLLTPWSRVLLVNLTGFQLVKIYPAFYVTRRFITAITSARHISLS